MVDEQKERSSMGVPPVEKRIPADPVSEQVSSQRSTGEKKEPLVRDASPGRGDEEIFQAIHDTINHILQLISGPPATQYMYNVEQGPPGYSYSVNYPQMVPQQVYGPMTGGVQYPIQPQAVAWPASTIQTPYLIQ